MKKLKQQILENNKLLIPSPTDRPTPSTSSSTCNSTLSTPSSTGNSTPSTPSSTGNSTLSTPSHITRSNDTYFYAIVILALLAIGVCVFLAYNALQAKNKKLINDKQNQQPKRRLCFRSYVINE